MHFTSISLKPMWCYIKLALILSVICYFELGYCGKINYDKFDVKQVLSSPERVRSFMNCYKNDNICKEDEKQMKRDIKTAVKTLCTNCTRAERATYDEVRRFVARKSLEDPEMLNLLLDSYLNKK